MNFSYLLVCRPLLYWQQHIRYTGRTFLSSTIQSWVA